jgi:probable H4MPT-linked C1 transfer pathway protein
MNNSIIGWDVGGAHLKAALLDTKGKLQHVVQVPCALWRGLSELEAAVDEVLGIFQVSSQFHAITMTGELVDLFPNRQTGVQAISQVMEAKLNGAKLFYAGGQFYAGALHADFSGFVTADQVSQHWQHIASANWLASAGYVAHRLQQINSTQHALLVDIGSTTTDLILLEDNQPVCKGFTDASRMQTQELVYTGVVRTPLMAVAQEIRFEQQMTSVAAEYFATTADVYRLTGDLLAEDDMADTADGKEKTLLASARRIARMIGHDVDDAPMDAWARLAQEFKSQQMVRLQEVIKKQLCNYKVQQMQTFSIIGAGVGSFLVKEIATAMNIHYLGVAELIELNANSATETGRWASNCLPAFAVAKLAYDQA